MCKFELKKIIIVGLMTSLFIGCSSIVPKPESINDIDKLKKEKAINSINIAENKLKNPYRVYFKETLFGFGEETIIYIAPNYQKIGYYNHKIHSYEIKPSSIIHPFGNLIKPSENTFLMNKKYYGIQEDIKYKYRCNGWYERKRYDDFKNDTYYTLNTTICNSKFFIFTYYENGKDLRFDKDGKYIDYGALKNWKYSKGTEYKENYKIFYPYRFKETIYNTNIESWKKDFWKVLPKKYPNGGFDIVYLDYDNIDSSLKDAIERAVKLDSKQAGIIFLTKDTKKFISAILFSTKNNIMENTKNSISTLISNLLNNKSKITYNDIKIHIPNEISKPKIPPVKQIKKSEFETKKKFNIRVKKIVLDRQNMIKQLQRNYTKAVYDRNAYIDMLQLIYKNHLNDSGNKNKQAIDELNKNNKLLTKLFFTELTSHYKATDIKYDAEEKQLYFNITDNKAFNQNVFIKVDSEIAKNIKTKNTYNILPRIKLKDNEVQFLGFTLTQDDEKYNVAYTNKNFKPEIIKVSIVSKNEKINTSISKKLKKHYQSNSAIIDKSKKETWYIDVANRINTKVPKWFSEPTSNKVIGYGVGDTLEEAKANARKDLAYMVSAKVVSSFESKTTIGSFKNKKEINKILNQSTNTKLTSKDYKNYKQDSFDGKWYVGLEYIEL